MAYLNTNSFYSSFAKKSPFSFTGSLGNPNTGNVSGSTFKPPPAPSATPVPAPAPAPSATGTPIGYTGLPPDPAYQAAISALSGSRDNTIAGLTQQRAAGLSAYGYTEDPTTHAIAFDPNNPYSQAALLRQHYQQSKTGNTTSYGAQGLLYDGSLQNAQNATTDQFNQSNNALQTAVINFLANNTNAENAAADNYNTGAAQALGTSLQNAASNPLAVGAASPPAIDPASVGLAYPLASGYELYRDPATGELKARKVGT